VNAALALIGLTESFGAKRAVDGLNLQVRRGCMFGLVGPNGAGKTTTLSMATGLLRPDAGTAYVLGHDVWSDPVTAKALMGVLPVGLRLFDRLSGAELLRYVGLLRRVPPGDIATRSAELLEALSLAEDRNTLVVEYSAGMTKKIGLACALISASRLLILDEPFEAVDPVSGEAIRSILRNYARDGGTVVMSSHVMELVESLCDELAAVAQGRVLAAGTVDHACSRRRQPRSARWPSACRRSGWSSGPSSPLGGPARACGRSDIRGGRDQDRHRLGGRLLDHRWPVLQAVTERAG
jgi:ABC-2 type transport system ATP-binding protein